VFVEIDRPGRVVRGWNWMAPPPEPALGGIDNLVEFLVVDSTLTITLTQTKDADGHAWTEVHIRHSGLPAEWVEDLRAWWHYQLAIAEHRGFGTR
jgi:hypothetical protein